MNTPNPVDPSPLPSVPVAVGATGLSAVLGYVVSLASVKYNIPVDVVGGLLGILFTGGTALWHRVIGK